MSIDGDNEKQGAAFVYGAPCFSIRMQDSHATNVFTTPPYPTLRRGGEGLANGLKQTTLTNHSTAISQPP